MKTLLCSLLTLITSFSALAQTRTGSPTEVGKNDTQAPIFGDTLSCYSSNSSGAYGTHEKLFAFRNHGPIIHLVNDRAADNNITIAQVVQNRNGNIIASGWHRMRSEDDKAKSGTLSAKWGAALSANTVFVAYENDKRLEIAKNYLSNGQIWALWSTMEQSQPADLDCTNDFEKMKLWYNEIRRLMLF